MPAIKIIIDHTIICSICSTPFVICHGCFRGHRYCSHDCRDHGYREARKRARKKYAQSPEARLDHCDRNRRYRINKKWAAKNIVMDKSSKKSSEALKPHQSQPTIQLNFCHFCGCKCFTDWGTNESKNSPQNFSYPRTILK